MYLSSTLLEYFITEQENNLREKPIETNKFVMSALNNNFMKNGKIVDFCAREYISLNSSMYFYGAKIEVLDFTFYHFYSSDCYEKQSMQKLGEHFDNKIKDVLNVFKSGNRARLNFIIHSSLDTKYRLFFNYASLGVFSGIIDFGKLEIFTYKADNNNLSFSEIVNKCEDEQSILFDLYRD